jgi:hypothetical protein
VKAAPNEERQILSKLWTKEDETLFHTLKQEIPSGPVLKRPDYARRFYVKTDWSKEGMGATLCQAETTEEAEASMLAEIAGGKCELDKTVGGLRLRVIEMISRTCKGVEQDYHSAMGEFATGRWAYYKWKQYLWYSASKWITDCSGNSKYGAADLMPTHQQQRWKMDMMRFDITFCHRPERMLSECNLLTRYNLYTAAWRTETDPKDTNTSNTTPPTTFLAWQAAMTKHSSAQ